MDQLLDATAAYGGKFAHPAIDGVHVLAPPMRTLSQGGGAVSAGMSVVVGSTTNESTFFLPPDLNLSAADFESALGSMLNNASMLDEALVLYPPVQTGSNRNLLAQAQTHQLLQCASLRVGLAFASSSSFSSSSSSTTTGSSVGSAHAYHFDSPDECEFAVDDYGVPHTAELPYVFDSWNRSACGPTPAEDLLARTMRDIWRSFAATGTTGHTTRTANPSPGSVVGSSVERRMPSRSKTPAGAEALRVSDSWPALTADGDVLEYHLVPGSGPYDVETARDQDFCDFWARDSEFA